MKKFIAVLVAVFAFCLVSTTLSLAGVSGVISENINLRQSPTKFSESLGVLGKGTSLTILETSVENRAGEYFLWLKVAIGAGGTGWVNADYVGTSAIGKLSATNVNLRSLPSPKSKSKGIFPRGTNMQCLGLAIDQSDVSLPLWWKVKLNSGENGWMRSDFIAVESSVTNSAQKTQKSTAMSDSEFAQLCGRGSLQQIETAIKAGVNINAIVGEAATALGFAAAENTDIEVIKALIKAGADVNDDHALTSAAGNPNPEVIEMFIKAGANVNKMLYMGGSNFTPLMVAAGNKNPEIATILIEAGANVNAKNEDGETALTIASEQNNSRVVSILTKAGAK